jgi:hypothetical protein
MISDGPSCKTSSPDSSKNLFTLSRALTLFLSYTFWGPDFILLPPIPLIRDSLKMIRFRSSSLLTLSLPVRNPWSQPTLGFSLPFLDT